MAFRQKEVEKLLAETGRRCCICGLLHNVQVHHIVPEGEGGKDDIDNAITLCPNCHSEVHGSHAPGRTTLSYAELELKLHRQRTIEQVRNERLGPTKQDGSGALTTLEIICGNSNEFERAIPLDKDPSEVLQAFTDWQKDVIGEPLHLPAILWSKLVKVVNKYAKEAKRCRIQINDIYGPMEAVTPTPQSLAWFGQNTTEIDIPPSGHAYAILTCKITKDTTKTEIMIPDRVFPWLEGSSATVTVIAWAEDGASDRQEYRLEMSEAFYPIIKELAKEERDDAN